MKKFMICAVALMMGTASLFAEGYKHSIGANVGSMYGASYKGFVFGNENLALVADLGYGMTASPFTQNVLFNGNSETYTEKDVTYSIWDFSANPNFVYQAPIAKGFSWFVGGGVSLGMAKAFAATYKGDRFSVNTDLAGKTGVNAIGGAEYKFEKVPLTIGMDFRPGYGLLFDTDKNGNQTVSYLIHYFDWKLAASVRYCF